MSEKNNFHRWTFSEMTHLFWRNLPLVMPSFFLYFTTNFLPFFVNRILIPQYKSQISFEGGLTKGLLPQIHPATCYSHQVHRYFHKSSYVYHCKSFLLQLFVNILLLKWTIMILASHWSSKMLTKSCNKKLLLWYT